MPHCELHYSNDLDIDVDVILAEVEAIILAHDAGSGQTKGRAYPAPYFRHTNFKASLSLLPKPHRDAQFVAALQRDVVAAIAKHLPRPCWMSIDIGFSGTGYHTEFLE
ncbi:hypothetical protein [uncultured Tateyamaria sp.]|uniref:hypothetical protein n=1 Tax=uncultured Tateyamaria sp. TaxID=455651 RepID=UPI002621A9C3|nr:hypothetical protein [uncultured Tateyamaria sp.]